MGRKKNSMTLFSPVYKGFLEPFELAFHFPFSCYPEEWDPRQKSLSFGVGRWGLLDEWCKRVKEKEKKEIWGLKKGKTPLEVYNRFFLFFGNFTLDSFGTIFTKLAFSFLSTPPKVIKNQHPYKWYLSHFINSQHLNNRPMLKKCW